MMIDHGTLKQLLRINDELLQLCKWLKESPMWNFRFGKNRLHVQQRRLSLERSLPAASTTQQVISN
jgi:hypothetical protein